MMTSQGSTEYKQKSSATMAFALTALILYFPANFFPFMTIVLYGKRNSTTVLSGIVDLANAGSWMIAIIIFFASVLIPFCKLVILFYLGLTAHNRKNQKIKLQLYKIVESIGRWSMLDIFLLAVLVSIMKLGNFAEVKTEPGSVMFALVVIFTMLSSAYFDPRSLEIHDEKF